MKMLNFVMYHENFSITQLTNDRSSRPEVFLGKDVLKICSKFTGEHPCKATLLKSHCY